MKYPEWYVINASPYDIGKVNNDGEKYGVEATNWPASVIFFQTEAEASAYSVSKGGAGSGGPTATTSKAADAAVSTASKAADAAVSNVTNLAIPGVSQIGTFFSSLGEANTWIRFGEVVLGLILLGIGVARLTHAIPVATQVAKTVGAVAA
jgi:hypothetical protein